MDKSQNIKSLSIIVNAGYADDVIAIARDAGALGATILNARGEEGRHEVFMGITMDVEKEIILCLTDGETADKIMKAIKEKAGVKTPAHSICFSTPVEKAVGLSVFVPTAKDV